MPRKLEVKLEVDADKGVATVKKVTKSVENLEKQSAKSSKNMLKAFSKLKLGLAAVGVAAVAALATFVKFGSNVIDLADKLDKMSIRLGIGINELDRLRRVADLGGISFEKLTVALRALSRRTGEAAMGTGEAQKAIKELGLNAKELIKLPLEKMFITVAGAIDKLDNNSKKLAYTQKILGIGGVETLQIFKNLGAQYAKTLSAFSDERVAVAVAFKDTMAILQHTMEDLAITLLPAFLSYMIQLEPYFKQFGDWLGVKGIDVQIIDTMKELNTEMEKLHKLQNPTFLSELSRQISSGGGGWTASASKSIGQDIEDTAKKVDMLRTKLQKLQNLQATIDAFAEKRKIKTPVSEDDDKKKKDAAKKLADELNAISHAMYKRQLALAEDNKTLELYSAYEKYTKLLDQYGQYSETRIELEETLDMEIAAIHKKYDDLEIAQADEKAKKAKAILDEQAKAIEAKLQPIKDKILEIQTSIADGLTDAWYEFINGTATAEDAIRKWASTFLAEMAKAIMQAQILKAIQSTTSYFGGTASSAFGSAIGGLFGRAYGGQVNKGQPYMVGEHGPEMFTPSTGGSISPNGQMGGGIAINTNITVESSGGNTQQDQEQANTIAMHFEKKVIEIMGQQKRYGGLLYYGGM